MEAYEQQKLSTARGFVYSYVSVAPRDLRPYIIFLHGFPSSSDDWRHQIPYFVDKGYGVIAPDLLGYGETSKPTDLQAYNGKGMVSDVMEIINQVTSERIIGVAHDWGSFILSRLANYHPSRFISYAFLDVGYSPPGFDLSFDMVKMIDEQIKQNLGFTVFGYFLFFDEADAADLMNKNAESVASLFYSSDENTGKEYMGAHGGMRRWIDNSMTAPWPAWLSDSERSAHVKRFAPSLGGAGYAAPINWYRAQLHGINGENDKAVPKENYILAQPTLLLTASKNFITKSANMGETMRPQVPDLTLKVLDCGHWMQIEKKDEVNEILANWFER